MNLAAKLQARTDQNTRPSAGRAPEGELAIGGGRLTDLDLHDKLDPSPGVLSTSTGARTGRSPGRSALLWREVHARADTGSTSR